MAAVLRRRPPLPLALLLAAWLLSAHPARAYDVLCRNGNAAFSAYFAGVNVEVGPPTTGRLAARRCRALLSWGNDEELVVARDVAEVDLDLFAVDLGLGAPVAAFQIRRAEADCCLTYKIYALADPPRLLRTLRGGGYYNAADSNLNGQVEIWTDDAAAVDGFEGMRAAQLPFPPVCVLRFDQGRLLDVSSEFPAYFDQEIARLRQQINPPQAERFKLADGRIPPPALMPVKQQILELVWAYLYSHREQKAWQVLGQMWPAADLGRIHSAILAMRARGMRAQLDGASDALPPLPADIQHSKIYDSAQKPARPIMIRFYASPGATPLRGKLTLNLVVDSAGKVWSAKVKNKSPAALDAVRRSTPNWKFIPALLDNHAVASRVRMTISVER